MKIRNLPHQFQLYIGFFLYALVLGAIFPRLGELQRAMQIGESDLGLGLLGFALGTQVSLMLAGGLIKKIGFKLVILLGIPLLGAAEIAASFMPSLAGFFICLVIAGLAIGMLEVVFNLEADRTEFRLGRLVMNRAHAFWSFGMFAAGLIGATAAQFDVSPSQHLIILNIICFILMALVFSNFKPAPARNENKTPPPKFVRPSIGILTLVAFTLSAMLLEGAGADWSVIYMRDIFDMPAFINGMALTLGALTQAVTRYFADPYIEKYGPVKIARILISLLGIGAIIVTFAPNAYLALAGFALIGVGTSSIFPLAMSAAAQRPDRDAATNVASLAQLSFFIFLLAPPILGYIAEHWGIRVSFGVSLPLILVSWFTLSSLKNN
ncbi:MAG: MFS transporter [Rhizobiales bacterium]|nr:MFS transporter [Hyphomicrobiales bacterium]NRB13510.1 MFS transporter [Hyphomicrobiales bacterium]